MRYHKKKFMKNYSFLDWSLRIYSTKNENVNISCSKPFQTLVAGFSDVISFATKTDPSTICVSNSTEFVSEDKVFATEFGNLEIAFP